MEEPDGEQILYDWLDELVEGQDKEQLVAIESSVREAIVRLGTDE